MISHDAPYNFRKDNHFLEVTLPRQRSQINFKGRSNNDDKPELREVATIALETPLTALDRQAKTEYTTQAYFNVEKKEPGANQKRSLFQ